MRETNDDPIRDDRAIAVEALSEAAQRARSGEFDAVLEWMEIAWKAARNLAGPARSTGCDEHPHGAVDPEAVDGCLLCEQRRRRAWRQSGRPMLGVVASDANVFAFTDTNARDRLMYATARHRRPAGEVVAFPADRVGESDEAAFL